MLNVSINRIRLLQLAVCLLTLTAVSHAWAQGPNGGQELITVGGFQIQFWEPGDGGGVGAARPAAFGANVADGDLGRFSAAERAAVIRSFNYWTQKLNLPANQGAAAPIIRVAKDISQANFNANAAEQFATTGGVERSNIYDRLVNGAAPTRDVSGVDGTIVIEPGFTGGVLNQLDTGKMKQLANGNNDLESTMVHEIAHLLGYTNRNDPHTNNIFLGTHFGANTLGVAATGVQMAPGDPAHTNLEFHNMTRGLPFGLFYGNNSPFSPAELTILDDMVDPTSGLSYDITGAFGRAFYTNGVGAAQNIATGFNSTDDYTYGLFLQSDNRNITQTGDITQSGYAATGIRVTGTDVSPNGNRVTVAPGTTIGLTGQESIGVLVSSGANHDIRVRGTLSATGSSSRAMVFDFGPNLVIDGGVVDSSLYGAPLVDDVDITGTVIGTEAAIEIGTTAAVNEINIMQGADITGDIISNAMTGTGLPARPTLTLGKTADGVGASTNVGDAGFSILLRNTIRGTNPFDVDQFNGTTNATGSWLVNDVLIQAGLFKANGRIFASQFNVNQGATLGGSGTIDSNVQANGDIAPGNSIGQLTINGNLNATNTTTFQIEATNGGRSPEPGVHVDTIDVNGTASINGGAVNVTTTGALDTCGYYRFITADSLIINQLPTYTNNIVLGSDQRTTLLVSGNDLGFAILRNGPLSPFAVSQNEINFANAFDQIRLDPDPRIQNIRDNLDLLCESDEIRDAINQLTGDIYASNVRHSLFQVANEMRFISQRIGGIHVRPEKASAYPDARASRGYTVRGQSPSTGFGAAFGPVMGSILRQNRANNYEAWVSGYGVGGSIATDGNAIGLTNTSRGTRFGGVRWWNDNVRSGFFGTFGTTDLIRSGGAQRIAAQNYLVGSFLHYQSDFGYWLLAGGGGVNAFEGSRNVNFAELSELNESDFRSGQGIAYLEKGFHFGMGVFEFQPSASVQYMYVGQRPFTETGGNTALSVGGAEAHSLRSNVGGILTANRIWADGTRISPFLKGQWQHEYLDDRTSVSSGFSFVNPPSFGVQGLVTGSDWGIIGTGIEMAPNNKMQIVLSYDALFNRRQVAHTGSGSLVFTW